MNFLKKLPTWLKALMALDLLLGFYALLALTLPIRFFWESLLLAIVLLLVGILIPLLFEGLKSAKVMKPRIANSVRNIMVFFIGLITGAFQIVMQGTTSYEVATEHLRNSEVLAEEIGAVKGFGFVMSGSIKRSTGSSGTFQYGDFTVIAKGEKAYKFVSVEVYREGYGDWQITVY